MKHLKTLDSFRTFAVITVIVGHWFPINNQFLKKVPLGAIGVTMFFVLSGFLITTILLQSRQALLEGKSGIGHALKTFYARRTIRIFPVYYLFLLCVLLFFPAVFTVYPGSFYWCLFYVSNIYSYTHNEFVGYLGHLWSLAVEEQYYLLWPAVILFVRPKNLYAVIVLFIAGSILVKLGYEILCPEESLKGMYLTLTPTCFDAFGIGGLTALARFNKTNFELFGKWLMRLTFLAVPLFFLTFTSSMLSNVLLRLSISIPSAALIFLLLEDKPGALKTVFSNRVLVYLGKISYGLYLWHMPIPQAYTALSSWFYKKGILIPFTHYSLLPFVGGNKQLVIYFIVLVTVSTASWFLFEKPINGLKSKFSYKS